MIKVLVDSYGDVSIAVYIVFIVTLVVGYRYKSSLLHSNFLRKFVEYFGNVSPIDDDPKAKAKAKSSRSARAIP